MLQHHSLLSTDQFSYTAAGREFIYPPFSGLLLYAVFQAFGYTGLSWLGAFAAVATVAVLLQNRSALTAALTILAVPAIAYRTAPRADLFTTVFFAIFLVTLWQFRREAVCKPQCLPHTRLWLLPIVMIFWVNLHPGFVAGFGAMAAYLAVEADELIVRQRRSPSLQRLRHAWPWLGLTTVITVVNPWGPKVYPSMLRQARSTDVPFIGEWAGVPLSWRALVHAFDLRDPESSYWWLVAIALTALAIAVWRRRIGTAVVLGTAILLSLRHLRYQGLFAITVVVVGGSVLLEASKLRQRLTDALMHATWLRRALVPGAVCFLLALTFLRIADLTSNRYYVVSSSTSLFGPGESWWFPERAAAFIQRERLPGNIFHAYTMGGFAAWRLGPQYRDYTDGRDVPFIPDISIEEHQLLGAPPDSAMWQEIADRRHINALLFSLARFGGLGSIDLQAYCTSTNWRPVYLDEVSVVLLRNTPENRPWLDRLTINCASQPLTPATSLSLAERFNFYANSAAVYFILGRDEEAQRALDRAEAIYPFDAGIHLTRAQLLQQYNLLAPAEREYRAALVRKETDAAWYALGRLYASEHRYHEAAKAIQASAELAWRPYENYKLLGQVELVLGNPERALTAFAHAEHESPFVGPMFVLGSEFYAQLAEGRAEASRQLGHMPQAITFQRDAIRNTPAEPRRWARLAELYRATGEDKLSQEAARHARDLEDRSAQR